MRFLENASRFSQRGGGTEQTLLPKERRRRRRRVLLAKEEGFSWCTYSRFLRVAKNSTKVPSFFLCFFPKRQYLGRRHFFLSSVLECFSFHQSGGRDTVQARTHTHTQQQQQPTPCGTRRLLLVSSVSFPGVSISLSLCLFARARAVFVLVNHLSHFTCGLQKLALTAFIARARRVVALLSHARTTTQ